MLSKYMYISFSLTILVVNLKTLRFHYTVYSVRYFILYALIYMCLCGANLTFLHIYVAKSTYETNVIICGLHTLLTRYTCVHKPVIYMYIYLSDKHVYIYIPDP